MRYASVLLVGLVVLSLFVAPGLAAPEDAENSEDESSEGIIDALNTLIDAIQDFTGDWDATLEEVLIAVIFSPFKTLAQQLLRHVTILLTKTPAIYPNSAVEEVHRDVLIVTYLLSTIVFMAAGILYMIGPVLGISYSEVRMVLPRVVIALIFASLSLPILQLGVDFSNALVGVFAPSGLTLSRMEMAGISAGLVLAYVINSVLLLAVVVLFILRSVYILFVAAISPLLALGWALPRVRKYSDVFIGGWFAALLMGPLDVLALKFSLAMLSTSIFQGTQALSNWILGVASFTLLLFVPAQLYGASQAAVGKARSVSSQVQTRVSKTRSRRKNDGVQLSQDERNRLEAYRGRKKREASTDGGRYDD